MRNKYITLHGGHCHFLVPAVLLASYYNVEKDATKKELRNEYLVSDRRGSELFAERV